MYVPFGYSDFGNCIKEAIFGISNYDLPKQTTR